MSYPDDHEALIRNSIISGECIADCDSRELCNQIGRMFLDQCVADGNSVDLIAADISCSGKVDGDCGATVTLEAFAENGEKITDVCLQSLSAQNRFHKELLAFMDDGTA